MSMQDFFKQMMETKYKGKKHKLKPAEVKEMQIIFSEIKKLRLKMERLELKRAVWWRKVEEFRGLVGFDLEVDIVNKIIIEKE